MLPEENDDDRSFEAAMSFFDKYVLDDTPITDAAAFRLPAVVQREHVSTGLPCGWQPTAAELIAPFEAESSIASSFGSTAPSMGIRKQNKRRRQMTIKERRKMLQKAGIYGDTNWMSKDSKLEIAYLHERIEKLQVDLQVLQSRKCRKPAAAFLQMNTKGSTPQIPKVWGEIARRQLRRLKETERENAQLKLAQQQQQKVARYMRTLVQKRAGHLLSDCSSFMDFSVTNQHVVHMLSSRPEGARDFPLLFRHLEIARQEVDAVFASNGLVDMVLTPSNVHLREGVNGKYLEAFSNKVLPFGLRAAAEATWDHFKGGEKHLGNGNIYEKRAKSLDDPYTIIEEFTKEMHSKNARADIKAQQLVRRYVEVDRDIIIWVSLAEPAEIKHKMLRGLTYHLRGYAMTKRSPASTPEHEVSQLQCVSLISLDPEAEAMYDSETVRAVTNFLIVTAAQKMQAHQEWIENALVDRQLRRRGITISSS